MGAPIVHFEIGCQDQPRVSKFYADLFGWEIQPFGDVAMFNTGSETGIQGHINALGHEPHNYVTVYAEVEDIDAMLARVQELGGKTIVPATEVPGAGHFAWFADPEGTPFGLWKSAPRG